MSRVAHPVGALVAAAVLAMLLPIGAAGRVTARAPLPTAGTELTLREQRFALRPGENWTARFDVRGPLDGVVVPATTSTTAAPTTTATPTTTAAPTTPSTASTPATAPATTTGAAPSATSGRLSLVVRRPITSRGALADALAGDLPTALDRLDVPIGDAVTVTGDRATLDIDVATTPASDVADALTFRLPGLYPVSVRLIVDGAIVADTLTFVERLPTEPATTPPMNLALVAAIADPGPRPTAAEMTRGRRDLAALADLGATTAAPISVVVPPVLVDGLGDDDPDLAAELGDALAAAEILAQPDDVLDPSSAVAIDDAAAFTRELTEGQDVLEQALPANPARRSAWLVGAPLSTPAAAMLRDLGFRLLVLDDAAYTALEGNIGGFLDTTLAVDVAVGDTPMPALVVDPVSARLARPAGDDAPARAIEILATLLTARRELGADLRRSAVLAAPDFALPDTAVTAALAELAADLPSVELVTLSALPSTTDTMTIDGVRLLLTLPSAAGRDLRERADRIDFTRLSAESSGSMLVDDAPLEAWREELATLLSSGLSDADVDAALARITAETRAIRDCIEAPAPFTFTLTGRSSLLRLNIRNRCDQPLVIRVRPSSPKLTFPDGAEDVELAARSVTEVEMSVRARGNGTSSVEIDLVTPAVDQDVTAPVVLTAHVNALTGLGQVVTGGAALVLASWWFSHLRRRRRERLGALPADDGLTSPTAVSPDAAEAVAVAHPDGERASSLPDP